jgi:hypothetical protein
MDSPLVKNLSGLTAATVGLVLLGWAALDWASYTWFVFSLHWR